MSTVKSLSKNDALHVETSCKEVSDSAEVAESAGLRYVSDMSPGIKRKRVGKHFSYIGLDGKPKSRSKRPALFLMKVCLRKK